MKKIKANTYSKKTLESVEKRVNELGLSEAIVQMQGRTQISVDIPGIQDIQKAKSILGNTASLSFHLVEYDKDDTKTSTEILDRNGNNIHINPQAILTGDAITYASTTTDNGQALVQVRLGGGNEQKFYQATRENIGKQIAIVLTEQNNSKNAAKRSTTRALLVLLSSNKHYTAIL